MTYLRLAYNPVLRAAGRGGGLLTEGPDIRLAPPESATAPTLRLAHAPGARGDNSLLGQRGVERLPEVSTPGLLVSFVYLKSFLGIRDRCVMRDWVLDSGAFSAHMSGTVIDLGKYIETCRELLVTDPLLTEVFALDVIGDPAASRTNAERMWAADIPAIPTFHYGTPWPELISLAREYPKIALGGVAAKVASRKFAWARQCFARLWKEIGPTRVHGFAMTGRQMVLGLPFHSVDATNWELGPCKFGRWQSFGRLSVRGSAQNLCVEVEYYLKLEREARSRWAGTMAQIEAANVERPWPLKVAPSVRLAIGIDPVTSGGKRACAVLLSKAAAPSIRLAAKHSGRIMLCPVSVHERRLGGGDEDRQD